jgi:hypothetical protein
MSLLKFLYRIKRIDTLIRTKATGSPDDFAEKLGISKSMLMLNLDELKNLGAPIEYSALHRSYIYNKEYLLSIDSLLTTKENISIRGGTDSIFAHFAISNSEKYKLSQTFFLFQRH